MNIAVSKPDLTIRLCGRARLLCRASIVAIQIVVLALKAHGAPVSVVTRSCIIASRSSKGWKPRAPSSSRNWTRSLRNIAPRAGCLFSPWRPEGRAARMRDARNLFYLDATARWSPRTRAGPRAITASAVMSSSSVMPATRK